MMTVSISRKQVIVFHHIPELTYTSFSSRMSQQMHLGINRVLAKSTLKVPLTKRFLPLKRRLAQVRLRPHGIRNKVFIYLKTFSSLSSSLIIWNYYKAVSPQLGIIRSAFRPHLN